MRTSSTPICWRSFGARAGSRGDAESWSNCFSPRLCVSLFGDVVGNSIDTNTRPKMKSRSRTEVPVPKASTRCVSGSCLCGAVKIEIDYPAFWAWHDHSAASRRAHGAAYATYVGSWRKRFRIIKGKADIARFEDKAARSVRGFCTHCGTPLFYERARSPHMVNIPRALFSGRTGRQPLYHIAIEELQEWAYTGEPLVPLKGYPGVVWQRSKKKKRIAGDDPFSLGRAGQP